MNTDAHRSRLLPSVRLVEYRIVAAAEGGASDKNLKKKQVRVHNFPLTKQLVFS